MHVELDVKSGHAFWTKWGQNEQPIDLQDLFNNYWNSTDREFTLSSKSPSFSLAHISDRERQRFSLLENIIGIYSYSSLRTQPFVYS
jgi:hypothetical protein